MISTKTIHDKTKSTSKILTLIKSKRLESPRASVSCSEHSSRLGSLMMEYAVWTVCCLSFTSKAAGATGSLMMGSRHQTLTYTVSRGVRRALKIQWAQCDGLINYLFQWVVPVTLILPLLAHLGSKG